MSSLSRSISDIDEIDDNPPRPVFSSSDLQRTQPPQFLAPYSNDNDGDFPEQFHYSVIRQVSPLPAEPLYQPQLLIPYTRSTRVPLQQPLQPASQSPSPPDQPASNDTSTEFSDLSQPVFHSSAGEEGAKRCGQSERETNEFSLEEGIPKTTGDVPMVILHWDSSEMKEVDHFRACKLIRSLEPMSKSLLSRYKAVRGEDYQTWAFCVICYDDADLETSCDPKDNDPLGPIQAGNERSCAVPKVVALPCKHLFHSKCLSPWLASNTACPKCRYELVPAPLTLNGITLQLPFVPPPTGAIETWVQAEEENISSCL